MDFPPNPTKGGFLCACRGVGTLIWVGVLFVFMRAMIYY